MAFKKANEEANLAKNQTIQDEYDGDETAGGEYEPLAEYNVEPEAEIRELNRDNPFNLKELDQINDVAELVEALRSRGIAIRTSASVFAGGYVHVEKEHLINVPLVIFHAEFFRSRRHNCDGVACYAMTERDVAYPGGVTRKIVFTDMSSGIFQQMRTEAEVNGGIDAIICPNGLEANTYTTEINGQDIEATTYRIPV